MQQEYIKIHFNNCKMTDKDDNKDDGECNEDDKENSHSEYESISDLKRTHVCNVQ